MKCHVIEKEYKWDMGHRLHKHGGKCKHLHGHTYFATFSLIGKIENDKDSEAYGMVMDFSELKLIIKRVIDNLDHGFVYCKEDKIMKKFFKQNSEMKHIEIDLPPTAEVIAEYLFDYVNEQLGDGRCKLVSVEVKETPTSTGVCLDS